MAGNNCLSLHVITRQSGCCSNHMIWFGSTVSLNGIARWLLDAPLSRGMTVLIRLFTGESLARNLFDPRDQLIHGLVNRHLLVDHAIHCLGPDVLVVENSEFVVLRELERHGAARILVAYRLAVAVLSPER